MSIRKRHNRWEVRVQHGNNPTKCGSFTKQADAKIWKMCATETGEYILDGSGYFFKRPDLFSQMVVWFVVTAALLIALPFTHKLIN